LGHIVYEETELSQVNLERMKQSKVARLLRKFMQPFFQCRKLRYCYQRKYKERWLEKRGKECLLLANNEQGGRCRGIWGTSLWRSTRPSKVQRIHEYSYYSHPLPQASHHHRLVFCLDGLPAAHHRLHHAGFLFPTSSYPATPSKTYQSPTSASLTTPVRFTHATVLPSLSSLLEASFSTSF
jgi:hypothetical protein